MLWKPDTCGCQMHFNGANEAANLTSIENKCIVHSLVPDSQLVDTILSENVGRQRVLKHLMDSVEEISEESTDIEGNTIKSFKKGLEPEVSFDKDRNFVVKLPEGVSKVSLETDISDKLSSDEVLTGKQIKSLKIE